jgi:hypothetical protein
MIVKLEVEVFYGHDEETGRRTVGVLKQLTISLRWLDKLRPESVRQVWMFIEHQGWKTTMEHAERNRRAEPIRIPLPLYFYSIVRLIALFFAVVL